MARGRRPSGANLVDNLAGSDLAKARLKAILRTLGGEIPIPVACEELGLCEAMFHRIRANYLEQSVGLLEPKTPGRKARVETPEAARIRQLEAECEALKMELFGAQVREEMARVLPDVLAEPSTVAVEKKRRTRRR